VSAVLPSVSSAQGADQVPLDTTRSELYFTYVLAGTYRAYRIR